MPDGFSFDEASQPAQPLTSGKANDLDPVYEAAGKQYGIDPDLLRAQTHVESTDNDFAVSPQGALGRSQFIPSTARAVGLDNPYDPRESIPAQAKLMRENMDKFGNPALAVMAYHGGTDQRQWGPKTQAYVDMIANAYSNRKAQAPAQRAAPAGFSFDEARPPAPPPEAFSFDAAKLPMAKTEAEAPLPSMHPAQPAQPMPVLDEFGRDVSQSAPGQGEVNKSAGAALRAGKEAFGSEPLGLSGQTAEALRGAGVFPREGEGIQPLRQVNEAIMRPVAAALDAVWRAGGAGFAAYQSAAYDAAKAAGAPERLARDIAAAPEAFFGMPGALKVHPRDIVPAREEGLGAVPEVAQEAPQAVPSAQVQPGEGGIPTVKVTPTLTPTLTQLGTEAQERNAALAVPAPPEAPPAAPVPPVPEVAARQAGVSPSTPEPKNDIAAQISALADPNNPKDAVFIAKGTPVPSELPPDATVQRRPEGALITTDTAKAKDFMAGPLDDTKLAAILGYPETSAEAIASGHPTAVQGTDAAGNVVMESVASPAGVPAAVEAAKEQAPNVRTVNPIEAQERRAEAPGGPERRDNSYLSAYNKMYAGPGAIFDPEAWRFFFGPLAKPATGAAKAARAVGQSIADGLSPMQSGTVRSQAFAANFANSLRQVGYHFGQIDKEIERSFTPNDRAKMGSALDKQSVFEQQVRDLPVDQQAAARADFDATNTGLSSLNPAQRHVIDMLDALSQDTWRQMQERGMVDPKAQGLPYYFPRQILSYTEGEGFSRPGGGGAGTGRGLDERGRNLTTAGPMSREHLTPEETEAAAKAKLGQNVAILQDIRSLPSRLAHSQRAVAGVDLMNAIEKVGKETGVDLVVKGDIPSLLQPGEYFTMADHPAFRRWSGSGWQAIHVSKEFEGPLKAVLTKPSATWYRAAQGLKGGVMSAIMYSPLIHLVVELSRSLPVMPGRILTLAALRDGSRLRRDLRYMDQATHDGLSPIGQGWHADPISIADQANVEGRNKFVAALAGMRDAVANGAKAIGGQTLHDIMQHPHQTLLWDQVFNLQVGIYDAMRNRYIEKGYQPDVAGAMAAHIANRYAGALPPEHLSRSANMAANLLLFSRSFTLGNLGVMKDMLNGAPSHLRARIEQMAGPEVARSAQSALRRKAITAFTMDIGLFYMTNSLLQAGIQALRQGPDQAVQDWLDYAHSAISGASDDPLSIFGVLPQHWNEPGKQDRVFAGHDSQGRGTYLRLPSGKVGEEFLGWFAKPGTMLENKMSPLVRPILESIFGKDTMGRDIYKPNPQTIGDHLRIAGAVVRHVAEALGPTSTIEGLHELYQQHIEGKKTQSDPYVAAAKVLGPLTGLAQVSSGFPGGPAAGELHAQGEREKYDLQKALPAIRDKVRAGDVEGATSDLRALKVPPALIRYYVRQTERPGPTRGSIKRLPNAPADVQERVRRDLLQRSLSSSP